MENYIMYNGRKIRISEEIFQKIKDDVVVNPFRIDKDYYYITAMGVVGKDFNDFSKFDKMLELSANACNDRKMMLHIAKEQVLYRLLYRFSVENGWTEEYFFAGWYISIDEEKKKYEVLPTTNKIIGTVFFLTPEIAERAIEEIVKPFYAGKLEVCKIWAD